MAKNDDGVKKALENLAEAATALSIHGAGGYTVDTSALDAVFVRALNNVKWELEISDKVDWYDPDSEIQDLFWNKANG